MLDIYWGRVGFLPTITPEEPLIHIFYFETSFHIFYIICYIKMSKASLD